MPQDEQKARWFVTRRYRNSFRITARIGQHWFLETFDRISLHDWGLGLNLILSHGATDDGQEAPVRGIWDLRVIIRLGPLVSTSTLTNDPDTDWEFMDNLVWPDAGEIDWSAEDTSAGALSGTEGETDV